MAEERKENEQMVDPFNIDLSLLASFSEGFEGTEVAVQESTEEEKEKEITTAEETKEITDGSQEETKEVPSSQDIKESSPFIPYAKLLVEEGITPNFNIEEFDGTPEGLLKAVQGEIQYGINKYKEENLHPRVKWLQDNLEEGVALEDLLKVDSQRMTLAQITSETLDNVDVQKNVARMFLKETTRFNESSIEKTIERLEATGDLGEESKVFFEELKQINAAKEQQLQLQAKQEREMAAKQQQEALNTFKTTLDGKKEVVSGIPLSQGMRDAIYKTLTTPVDVDKATGMPLNEIAVARAKDPINFEINLAYLFKATKGFTDWSVFGTAGKKAAIKEFEDSVRKIDFSQTKQTTTKPDINKDLIEQMELIARQSRSY